MDDRDRIIRELQLQNQKLASVPPGQGVITETPDMDKWEMDTSVFLDSIKNQLLGKTQENGVWVNDPSKEQIMNDFGVHRFISELQTRINIHMQMSELDKQEIKCLTADAGEAYADLLEDNWEKWGIGGESLSSELMSIGLMFTHSLWIMLHIAKNAGMRKHREKRGIKSGVSPGIPTPEGIY
ncbi:MAG TPA: hypothetical protein PLG47_04095 [Candidatus Dojkabacteria bacterium]|nr:hypothetical protein [Candidatus Dojkabacteria bacterium]